jgi:hypothetical protein
VDLFAFVFGAAMSGSEARLDEVERKSEIDWVLYSERERERCVVSGRGGTMLELSSCVACVGRGVWVDFARVDAIRAWVH